jgi:hypothetical protein
MAGQFTVQRGFVERHPALAYFALLNQKKKISLT